MILTNDENVIISVYDKTGLDIIAKFLIKKIYHIPTGGTSDFLKKITFHILKFLNTQNKKKYYKVLRVKTFHPKIFGGLLELHLGAIKKNYNLKKLLISIC